MTGGSGTRRLALVLAGAGGFSALALGLGFAAGRYRLTAPLDPSDAAATAAAARPVSTAAPLATAGDADTSSGITYGVVGDTTLQLGEPPPDFTLPGADGVDIALADYLGSPILINFFATWCAPCRVEMPHLQAAYEEHAADGLVVLAVDVQETEEQVGAYLRDLNLSFPAAIDADGHVSLELYRVGILPTSVLVGRDGEVALVSPRFYASREELEADLRFILPE